jgi:hypothetical protein
MTIKKFFSIFLLQLAVFTAIKTYFYQNGFNFNVYAQFLYWVVTAVLTTAFVRTVGVMNYLEAIFTAFVWVVFGLLADLIITSAWAGLAIFSSMSLWVGYGIMALFVFMMHKKRHVYIRKGLFKDPHAPGSPQPH